MQPSKLVGVGVGGASNAKQELTDGGSGRSVDVGEGKPKSILKKQEVKSERPADMHVRFAEAVVEAPKADAVQAPKAGKCEVVDSDDDETTLEISVNSYEEFTIALGVRDLSLGGEHSIVVLRCGKDIHPEVMTEIQSLWDDYDKTELYSSAYVAVRLIDNTGRLCGTIEVRAGENVPPLPEDKRGSSTDAVREIVIENIADFNQWKGKDLSQGGKYGVVNFKVPESTDPEVDLVGILSEMTSTYDVQICAYGDETSAQFCVPVSLRGTVSVSEGLAELDRLAEQGPNPIGAGGVFNDDDDALAAAIAASLAEVGGAGAARGAGAGSAAMAAAMGRADYYDEDAALAAALAASMAETGGAGAGAGAGAAGA